METMRGTYLVDDAETRLRQQKFKVPVFTEHNIFHQNTNHVSVGLGLGLGQNLAKLGEHPIGSYG